MEPRGELGDATGGGDRVEVPRNVVRFAVLCGVLAFCALGGLVALVVGVVSGDPAGISSGVLGLVVFALPAWLLSRPLRRPSPALVLDAEGFEDRTGALVDPLRVPWSQVVEIGIARPWTRHGRRQLVGVRLRDPGSVIPAGSWRRSFGDASLAETGFDHVVETRLTTMTPEELAALLERHRAASE